jgi:hypothetical protein
VFISFLEAVSISTAFVVFWSLLSYLLFFASGHQAMLSVVRWQVGLVGLSDMVWVPCCPFGCRLIRAEPLHFGCIGFSRCVWWLFNLVNGASASRHVAGCCTGLTCLVCPAARDSYRPSAEGHPVPHARAPTATTGSITTSEHLSSSLPISHVLLMVHSIAGKSCVCTLSSALCMCSLRDALVPRLTSSDGIL